MSTRAYVLIEAEVGQAGVVVVALHKVPAVHVVDVVTGPYDIIATIETVDQLALGRVVMDELQTITGLRRTITCVVIE
jgi:DNA-binding Lrp family transcriptional regulator